MSQAKDKLTTVEGITQSIPNCCNTAFHTEFSCRKLGLVHDHFTCIPFCKPAFNQGCSNHFYWSIVTSSVTIFSPKDKDWKRSKRLQHQFFKQKWHHNSNLQSLVCTRHCVIIATIKLWVQDTISKEETKISVRKILETRMLTFQG